jgi:LuxR family maltose regulon positive regulatory protein
MSLSARHLRLQKPPSETLRAGHEALARGDWSAARSAFESALAQEEAPEALEGLGATLCWTEDIPGSLKARERAFGLYQERGDRRSAARVATQLAVEFGTHRAEFVVADAWFQRATRLLEGLEAGPEHAWLKIWQASIRTHFQGDAAGGRPLAEEAARLCRDLGIDGVQLMSSGLEGLRLVDQGRIAEGMKLLDEAATAAVTGELKDLEAGGQACCYVLTTCERVRDYGRALQWLDRVIAHHHHIGVGRFLIYCRGHYVGTFTWRGEWAKAEAEIEAAYREAGGVMRAAVLDMRVREAELRRLQGRWEQAAAALGTAAAHPAASLGLAALALDQGDPGRAIDLVHRHFRSIAEEEHLVRAAGDVILCRAHAAIGDRNAAAEAAARVRALAAATGTDGMSADLRACEGAVAAASRDLDQARRSFEDAIDLFARSPNPYETARCRVDLAQVLLALGRIDGARLEARTALATARDLGAGKLEERAERLLGQMSGKESKPVAHGLSRRQVDVLRFLAQGLSNRQIGERLFVSEFTVKRHVADILAKLHLPSRAAAAAYAAENNLT